MANTTKKASTKTTQTKRTAQAVPTPEKEEPVRSPKKALKLDDTMLVSVQSNTHGTLIYINQRTGDETIWHDFGDIQPISVADLRAMRGSQRKFFENNWIFVKGMDEPGMEDLTPADIYNALNVSQYYKDSIDPDNFDAFFAMSDAEIRRRVDMMSSGAKLNLVVATNDAIRDGRLDSIQKVKLLEGLLGCELLELK